MNKQVNLHRKSSICFNYFTKWFSANISWVRGSILQQNTVSNLTYIWMGEFWLKTNK